VLNANLSSISAISWRDARPRVELTNIGDDLSLLRKYIYIMLIMLPYGRCHGNPLNVEVFNKD